MSNEAFANTHISEVGAEVALGNFRVIDDPVIKKAVAEISGHSNQLRMADVSTADDRSRLDTLIEQLQMALAAHKIRLEDHEIDAFVKGFYQ